MRGLELIAGLRVVADPAALDALAATDVIRIAPDEAFLPGATAQGLAVADEHAIVEPEAGFVGAWLTAEQLAEHVVPRLEWPLPTARPALAQGLVAGVPARLWLRDDGTVLLLTAAAYAHELDDVLGPR